MALEILTIREMETQDLDEVLDMEKVSSLTPWSRNLFIDEMRQPWAHCYITKGEGAPKGQVRGFICFRNIGQESELLNICVHPLHRQIGIGRRLMEFYIDFCRGRGIKTFYLEVNISNHSAIHLYQSFTYLSTGMRKKYYQGKTDALLMVKKN